MSYELALELKNAGFPGSDKWHRYETVNAGPRMSFDNDEDNPPTLSELIEACVKLSADGDFHLEHLMQGGGEDWGAATCWKPVSKDEWFYGSTPEEAVARLYLALRKQ